MAIVNLTHTGEQLDQAISNVLANYVDTSDATALQGEIVNTKTAYVNGVKVTGNMVNRGAVSGEVTTRDGVYTVPVGYHNGSGVIKIATAEQDKIITGNIKSGVTILGVAGATNVVDTTNAVNSATDATLLSGKKAFVNGESRTGTMPNIGQQNIDISAKATSVTPSTGYHNGSGVIKIATAEQNKIISGNIKSGVTILGVAGATNVIDTTNVTDSAANTNILSGKKAFVNGTVLTGSMTNVGAQTGTISTKAGTVTPTAGYHNGSGSVSISSTEQAKIIAGNIKSGVTILGQAGSSNVVDTTSGDAVASDLANGKKAWVKGVEITGTGSGGGSWLNVTGMTVTDINGNINITGLSFTPLLIVGYMLIGEGELMFTIEKANNTWYLTSSTVYRNDITANVASSYGEIHLDLNEFPAGADVTYSVSGIG